MSAPEIIRHSSPDDLAADVAAQLVQRLVAVQAEGREPQIGLTGGSIAVTIHEALVPASRGTDLDWSRVVVWWGDERYVPDGDPERNARQAREALLDHVDVDPAKVHEMPTSEAIPDIDAAAASYAEELREHGGDAFDVLMLGIGPDGHCASLFPGFPQLDVTGQATVAVTGSPKPPPQRISLTFEALNRSREVWFVAAGDGKAEAVRRATAEDGDVHDTPARGVSGQQRTLWFLDAGSASRLPR